MTARDYVGGFWTIEAPGYAASGCRWDHAEDALAHYRRATGTYTAALGTRLPDGTDADGRLVYRWNVTDYAPGHRPAAVLSHWYVVHGNPPGEAHRRPLSSFEGVEG